MTEVSGTTSVFTSADDVPTRPDANLLSIGGLTLIRYLFAETPPDGDPVVGHEVEPPGPLGPAYHVDKLWPGSGIEMSGAHVVNWLPEHVRLAAGATGDAHRVFLLRLDPRHALVLAVITLAAHDPGYLTTPIERALSTDETIALIRVLVSEESDIHYQRQVASLLESLGSRSARVTTVPDALAIELWDIEGSQRSRPGEFEGVAESRQFAWELSALLSHDVDHVSRDGLWTRQRPEQVFGQVGRGFSFLNDQMSFVTASTCLEVCNLTNTPRRLSADRMRDFGFDSSAIFTTSTTILRGSIAAALASEYRARLRILSESTTFSRDESSKLTRDHLRDSELLERVVEFPRFFREERGRAIDARAASLRAIDRDVERADRAMNKVAQLSGELANHRQEAQREREGRLIALVGIGIALFGVPSVVGQVDDWVRRGDWTPIAISATVSVLVVALITAIFTRRRGV